MSGLYIIPILAVLILVHEIGHFVSARLCGVKVEEFGIGIPPRLKGWTRNGVIWSINAIPFGGFVRVKGEDGGDMDPGSMNTKSPGQRAFFLAAGSAMNVLLAVVLMAIVVGVQGTPTGNALVFVNNVVPGSPAEQAGWRAGDRFVEVNGQPVRDADVLIRSTNDLAGQPLNVVVERDGQLVPTTVVPRDEPPRGEGPTGIGLRGTAEYERVPAVEVLPTAIRETWNTATQMIQGLVDLLTGGIALDQLAGPIGMGQLTNTVVETTALPVWVALANLSILLSLNLAVLNLLPLPALDGGRLFFVLIELLRGGRRIAPEREGVVHFVGLVVLLGVMFLVAFSDIRRILNGGSFFQ